MLGSHLMHRAGAACCDMLIRSLAMFAEQISVEMGCPLLQEGAGAGGNISWREKWWRDAKEHSGCSGWKGTYGLPSS